jgi:hypothetical protein
VGVRDSIGYAILVVRGNILPIAVSILCILRLDITMDVVMTLVAIGAGITEMELMEISLPYTDGLPNNLRSVGESNPKEVGPFLIRYVVTFSKIRIKGPLIMALEAKTEIVPVAWIKTIPSCFAVRFGLGIF